MYEKLFPKHNTVRIEWTNVIDVINLKDTLIELENKFLNNSRQ